jgi:hypothetical protein
MPRLPSWAYEPEEAIERGIDPATIFSSSAAYSSSSSSSSFRPGIRVSQREYVPQPGSAAANIQTIRRTVPCAMELKEVPVNPGVKSVVREACRYEFDPVTDEPTRVCGWMREEPPKKLEYQPLECDEEETRALQGYKVERRVIDDGDVHVQNVVTPQIGVTTRRVGEPRPVGKPLPVQRVVTPEEYALEQALDAAAPNSLYPIQRRVTPDQYALEQALEVAGPDAVETVARYQQQQPSARQSAARQSAARQSAARQSAARQSAQGRRAQSKAKSKSKSRRSRSRSRSRSPKLGGGVEIKRGGQTWTSPSGSTYYVAPTTFLPTTSLPFTATSSFPSYVLAASPASNTTTYLAAPGSVANLSSIVAREETYGVGWGGLPRGFPFSYRHKPLSLTEYPSYWRWLASLDKELNQALGLGDNTLYAHRVDEKTDTIATLEAYILAGVWRAVDKGYLINADKLLKGGATYRNIMHTDFAALAGGVQPTPWSELSRSGIVMAVQQFSIVWRAKPIVSTDSDFEAKNNVLNAIKSLHTQISEAAIKKQAALGASVMPAIKVQSVDANVLLVREAELLALLARLQYFGKTAVNMSKVGTVDTLTIDLKSPSQTVQSNNKYVNDQLLGYIRASDMFAADADMFTTINGISSSSSFSSLPQSSLFSSSGVYRTVQQPAPRVLYEVVTAQPEYQYTNIIGASGGTAISSVKVPRVAGCEP